MRRARPGDPILMRAPALSFTRARFDEISGRPRESRIFGLIREFVSRAGEHFANFTRDANEISAAQLRARGAQSCIRIL